MEWDRLCRHLADLIIGKKQPGRALIVGINGVDASGKTTLARNLNRVIGESGRPVCGVSIDDFHQPREYRYRRGRESPEAYYQDSFNYEVFAEEALKPVFEARTWPVLCRTKIHDLVTDCLENRFHSVCRDTIMLAEGVFLFRPEIRKFLHIGIFLRSDFATVIERAERRDAHTGPAHEIRARYERKYIPGQRLYFESVAPETLADIIVDTGNIENPEIVYARTFF